MYGDASFAEIVIYLRSIDTSYCSLTRTTILKLFIGHLTKQKSVTRLVRISDNIDFENGFDLAFAIKADIQMMTNTKLSLIMCANSLSLFDVITKATLTKEKHLMNDLSCVEN